MSVTQIKAMVGELSEGERDELARYLDAENQRFLAQMLPLLEEAENQEPPILAPLPVRHDNEQGWLASFQQAIHAAIAQGQEGVPLELPTNLSTTWKRVKTHRLLSHNDL